MRMRFCMSIVLILVQSRKKKVYKTWESIHCTSDDSLKDSVNGKEVTELLVA